MQQCFESVFNRQNHDSAISPTFPLRGVPEVNYIPNHGQVWRAKIVQSLGASKEISCFDTGFKITLQIPFIQQTLHLCHLFHKNLTYVFSRDFCFYSRLMIFYNRVQSLHICFYCILFSPTFSPHTLHFIPNVLNYVFLSVAYKITTNIVLVLSLFFFHSWFHELPIDIYLLHL